MFYTYAAGKIQALKKTATKGDKKKCKEVSEEISKLENDLKNKQKDEVADLETRTQNGEVWGNKLPFI